MGSRVKVRFSHEAVMTSSGMGSPVTASMPALTEACSGGRVVVHEVLAVGQALDEALDDVGVLVEVGGAHQQVGGDELAVRPQVGFVDEHVAAALLHQAGGPGLGDPTAVDGAVLEGGQRVGVVQVDDGDVTATGIVEGVALFGQPGP